jgi:ABC-2 type transport system permease protein
MLRSAPVSLSSISRRETRSQLSIDASAALASWRAMFAERWYHMGVGGGLAIWLVQPIIQIAAFSIIYGSHSLLLGYLVVAQAANMFAMNTVFWVGEILDRERMKGTLVSLFLAPCSRFAWLSGFILAGVAETVVVATVTLIFGRYAFDVHFDPNIPAVAISLTLFLVALWGMGLIFSGFGLLLKKANPLANLIWNGLTLLGGAWFPVSQLPDWLRYPARALPLGYGFDALAASMLRHASFTDLAPQLLPLAGFAVGLPLLGVCTFNWLERLVRERGELDLY